jgi:hypothetical protein
MNPRALSDEATLQRTRLLLGLTQGAAVVEWADAHILAMPTVPEALLELSLTSPTDLSALRLALGPLSEEPESPAILQRVLQEVAADLLGGRRNVADTAAVLRQMRLMLRLPAGLDAELDPLIDTLMLAEAGIGVSVGDAEEQVRRWALSAAVDDARARSMRPANGG